MIARDCPRIAGGTYFFSVRLTAVGSQLLVDRVEVLRAAFREVLAGRPVQQDAVVILPDHLHAVWTLPRGDAAFLERWEAICARFETTVREDGVYQHGSLWQRNLGAHVLWSGAARQNHVRYCWINPVKHRLAVRASDWPHSSFHRDVAQGRVEREWSGEFVPVALDLGLAAE